MTKYQKHLLAATIILQVLVSCHNSESRRESVSDSSKDSLETSVIIDTELRWSDECSSCDSCLVSFIKSHSCANVSQKMSHYIMRAIYGYNDEFCDTSYSELFESPCFKELIVKIIQTKFNMSGDNSYVLDDNKGELLNGIRNTDIQYALCDTLLTLNKSIALEPIWNQVMKNKLPSLENYVHRTIKGGNIYVKAELIAFLKINNFIPLDSLISSGDSDLDIKVDEYLDQKDWSYYQYRQMIYY